MDSLVDLLGVFVSSLNVLFAIMRFLIIGIGVRDVIDSPSFEFYELLSFWDWWKIITWSAGLSVFALGNKFFHDLRTTLTSIDHEI